MAGGGLPPAGARAPGGPAAAATLDASRALPVDRPSCGGRRGRPRGARRAPARPRRARRGGGRGRARGLPAVGGGGAGAGSGGGPPPPRPPAPARRRPRRAAPRPRRSPLLAARGGGRVGPPRRVRPRGRGSARRLASAGA